MNFYLNKVCSYIQLKKVHKKKLKNFIQNLKHERNCVKLKLLFVIS